MRSVISTFKYLSLNLRLSILASNQTSIQASSKRNNNNNLIQTIVTIDFKGRITIKENFTKRYFDGSFVACAQLIWYYNVDDGDWSQ